MSLFNDISAGLREAIEYAKNDVRLRPKELIEEIDLAKTKIEALKDKGDEHEVMSAYWEGKLDALKYVAALFNVRA